MFEEIDLSKGFSYVHEVTDQTSRMSDCSICYLIKVRVQPRIQTI